MVHGHHPRHQFELFFFYFFMSTIPDVSLS